MTDYVVLAADTHKDYDFLIPITARVWEARTHYKPLILRGPFQKDRLSVKLSRWYSWRMVSAGDRLLLTDVDCWPIDGSFFKTASRKLVTLFYADAFQRRMHTTLNALYTREALEEITLGKKWEERLEEIRQRPEDWEGRHSDDVAQSELLMAWEGYPGSCQFVDRGPSPPATRIDRSRWPEKFNLDGMVDAHLPRDASDTRVWRMILPLFDLLCPQWSEWVRQYREAWLREWA